MDQFNLSEEVMEKFKEEGIDAESFELLDDETISKIFPKAGPRLIFKKKYENYKKENEGKMGIKILAEIHNLLSPSYSTTSDTLTIESSGSGASASSFEEPIEIQIDSELKDLCSPNKKHLLEEDDDDKPVFTDDNDNNFTFTNLFEGGLENILKSTIDGKIVLLRKLNLNNDCRQRIVKEIVNYLIGRVGVQGVRTFMLAHAAEEITKLFPNEVKETYYIPYTTSLSKKRAAKGKLWSRFVNVRNAINTAEKAVKVAKKSSPIKEYQNLDTELELLTTIIEPKEKVMDLWILTYEQRRHILRSATMSVHDIFNRYIALNTSIGPYMIESDFNTRYTDKTDIIYSRFPLLVKAVLAEADLRKVVVISEQEVGSSLKVIFTLPYLFPAITLKNKRKSGNWRPSRSEVLESFFLHIENFEELNERKAARLEKLKEYNLALQPFGVICGPLKNVAKYCVIINDIIYTFDSLIRAIEILYKAYHALDIEYPHECQHIWQLIEELVFEMKTSPASCTVSALCSDLKKFL